MYNLELIIEAIHRIAFFYFKIESLIVNYKLSIVNSALNSIFDLEIKHSSYFYLTL